jgi:hypothetical protein
MPPFPYRVHRATYRRGSGGDGAGGERAAGADVPELERFVVVVVVVVASPITFLRFGSDAGSMRENSSPSVRACAFVCASQVSRQPEALRE